MTQLQQTNKGRDMGDKPVVGFIGLGLMGHGMAKNIRKGGYELWVRGRNNRKPVESLLSLGAKEAAGPSEMAAKCDIIHLCLSNSPQVESVLLGDEGIIAHSKPGLIVVDTSTSDPGSTLKLSRELSAKGAYLVDAPLGRTPKEAEEGTLDAMVGCEDAVFERVRPVIECWAGRITRLGPVSSGHKMKLLMNFIGMSYGALFSEAVVLGAKIGISPQTIREVIGPSRMGNGFFDTFMRYVVDRDENAHKFAIANAAKDLRYLNNMAADVQMMTIMGSAARHYYAHAEAIGHADAYLPILSDLVGKLNGVNMADEVRKGTPPAQEAPER
jgi:3-hydroxyisobutyrate dehydrogenase-like beta-hydroxyacid dehydrogenase